jgi:hypothetical protein
VVVASYLKNGVSNTKAITYVILGDSEESHKFLPNKPTNWVLGLWVLQMQQK